MDDSQLQSSIAIAVVTVIPNNAPIAGISLSAFVSKAIHNFFCCHLASTRTRKLQINYMC